MKSPWRAYNARGRIVATCETFRLALMNAQVEAEKNEFASVGPYKGRGRSKRRVRV